MNEQTAVELLTKLYGFLVDTDLSSDISAELGLDAIERDDWTLWADWVTLLKDVNATLHPERECE